MREAKEGGGIWLAPNAGCQVLEKCLVIELCCGFEGSYPKPNHPTNSVMEASSIT